jgi:hypothetical protein
VVVAETRPEVEAAGAAAKDKLDAARAEVTAARLAYLEADAAWLDTGARRSAEKRRECSDALERCELLAKRAEDRYDETQVALARIERAEQMETYRHQRDLVAAYLRAREERASRWVALDRQADQLAVEDARELVDVVDHYDQAEAIANAIGMRGDLDRVAPKQPTVAQLRLETSRIVTAARHAEMRDPVAPAFLAVADLHYSKVGANADELQNIERQVEIDAATAHASAVAQAMLAGRIAGANEAAALAAPATETVIEEEVDE